jgi:hypothetical protein
MAIAVAFAGCIALAGCSKTIVQPSKPPTTTPPPPQQQANVAPTSWFSGPDPDDASAGWQIDPGPIGGRFILAPPDGWYDSPGIPHTMLSADSLLVFPKDRPERRTFFELYGDRIWLRQEGDTVHTNSWVILPSGGSDPDSPYSVLVNTELLGPFLREFPVLKPGGPNGSPIGFRLRVKLRDRMGRVDQPSEGLTYPHFDAASEFDYRIISGYYAALYAGRAYATASAVDGDGNVDRRIDQQPGGALGVVDRVDAGGGSAEDVALRKRIMTFYVDHPPRLLQDNASFRPVTQQVFTSRVLVPGSDLDLVAVDDDPFDALSLVRTNTHVYSHVGGPKGAPILRRRIAILGKLASDPARDTCWVAPGEFMNPAFSLSIPDWIANGPITVLVRLCDCFSCDVAAGPGACPAFAGQELRPTFGTCVDTAIPCQLAVPGPTALVVH